MATRTRRARSRTWTLEALDREATYRLFFDPETYRWEAQDPEGRRVVTRESARDAQRAARREAGAP
jgi:hypothetical protein